MIAVCGEDGQWERRRRNEAIDGPQPYTLEWYNGYLRKNNLPTWFLMAGHLDILVNPAEAKALGITDAELLPQREIPSSYLAVRYPTPPQFPELVGVSPHQGYEYTLSEEEQLRVARYFPATDVLGANRPVLIMPGGYIVVHHHIASTNSPLLFPAQLSWSGSAASRASYALKKSDALSLNDLLTPSAGKRSGIAAVKSMYGGFVDPIGHLAGVGAWEWLEEDVDNQYAQMLGFKTPADLAVAISRGHLRAGRGAYAAPSIVWQPDKRYFNPAQEPNEPGRWEFCTDESRAKAREDFGGQDAFGLAQIPRPGAADIWQLRQYFKHMMVDSGSAHDPTAEIDLVWILAGDGETAEAEVVDSKDGMDLAAQAPASTTETPSVAPETDTDAVHPQEADAGHGFDKITGLAHEPRNRGENDQTASDGRGDYYTRMIKGKKITVDRARAHAVKGDIRPQLHRMWAYTNGGKWQRFPETKGKIDWTDPVSVEKINKWRQQNCKRNNWGPKRTTTREPYSKEQRAWVFEQIAMAGGGRPACGAAAICADFNEKFGASRQPKAIEALMDRLMKEYKANDGKMKARPDRVPGGAKKKGKGKKAVKDQDEDENDDTTMGETEEQTDVSMTGVDDSSIGKIESSTQHVVDAGDDSDEDAPHEPDFDILG